MEAPIAQPTYIFPAQEFMLHTLRCQSRLYDKLCFQDDPEDILESNTALLLAESFQNTPSIPLQKSYVSINLSKLWSFSGASYRSTRAFYTSWVSKTSSSKSESQTETEGDYSFTDSRSKFFFGCANVRCFLRLQLQQIPNLSGPFLGFLIHFTVR